MCYHYPEGSKYYDTIIDIFTGGDAENYYSELPNIRGEGGFANFFEQNPDFDSRIYGSLHGVVCDEPSLGSRVSSPSILANTPDQ